MADCKTETWTLEEIRESLEKETNGNKKIVIPMFQRGKRWDSKKKECFIDSLKKKYPIGTLLFYKTVENQKEIYTLIDGLQRGSTIKEYLSNPTKFFNIVELNEESLNKLYSLIIVAGSFEAQKKKIDDIIIEYFKTLNSYDDINSIELFGKLSNEFPILKDHLIEYNNTLKDEFNRLKKEYNDLAKGTLPAIVYTGDEGTLPEIFERINSKGVALTEYEIYAASWPRKEFKTSNSDLVEYVLKKYDILNDADYTISGYDRDEKRINKHTNAFEYVFGLSKYLQNKYASLNFYRNLKDDETNPVAFQLLNACFNNKHGDIKDVHKIITRFSNNIDVLEKTLTDVIEFVNKCIEPVLKFKANSRNNNKIYHSQYQIMSLISFTFRKKYDVDSNVLKIQDNWKESKKKLQSNIWKYYVYDIITKYWFDGGTNKIHTGNNENRYFIDLTRGQFVTAFDSYCESLANRHENKNVANPSDIDYVILNTIYLNIFSAMDQLSIDRFDVEHIATKEQMKKLNDVTKGNGLPISHLANLCYLPEFENRSKKSNNFYQDNAYLAKSKITLEEIEKKYSFTTKKDLEWMDLPYSNNDFDVLESYYKNEFLKGRTKTLKSKFLQALGFEEEEIEETLVKKVENIDEFNDQYFRTTKPGTLAKQLIEYMFKNELLNENDIFNLKDKEYSHSKTGCAFPIIVEKKEDTFDSLGRTRYYHDPIKYKGKEYYICREWYESDRKYLVPWIKEIILK